MTTTNGTDIVPLMHNTGVSLWTPGGPHIIHAPGDTTPDLSHTGTVGTHTGGHTGPGALHTPSHTGTVGTHTGGHTGPGGTPADQAVSPVGTHGGPHTGHGTDTVGTHDDAPGGNAPMLISEVHRAEVAALPHKSDQIRHICAILGHFDTAEVHQWLEACGIEATRKYVSRIVNEWRDENKMDNTDSFRALTEADLAALDAQHGTDQQGDDSVEVPAESEEVAAELAARVRQANARLSLQADPALTEVLSEAELAEERELAEKRRSTRREIERRQLAAELARAKRMQANEEAIAKSEASDARWLERARSKKRRLVSPDAKLAQLVRNSEWSSRALIAAVAAGMIWSAVNAQKNLVPTGDKSDPLYWLSYFVEAMISLPLIVIMVASTTATRWGRKAAPEEKRKIIAVELVLLAMTLTLNVGKHLTPPQGVGINWMDVFKFGVAPVMVGILLQVHAAVSDHYAGLILDSDKVPTAAQSDEEPAQVH
ncbi:hypothetical protein ACWDUN_29865 [Mycobacterium sp. NPDC003323]